VADRYLYMQSCALTTSAHSRGASGLDHHSENFCGCWAPSKSAYVHFLYRNSWVLYPDANAKLLQCQVQCMGMYLRSGGYLCCAL